MNKEIKDKILDKLNSPAIGYENEEIANEILELFQQALQQERERITRTMKNR